MQGQIVKIMSDMHVVRCEGKTFNCKCRGIFRKDKIIPLVGDYVIFDKEKLVIEKINPRKNEFKRPAVSNIDQAFLITSLKTPDFSLNLLDKLLVLMEVKGIIPVICITKEDLMNEKELESIKDKLSYYKKIGYTVVSNQKLSVIKELLKGKTSVFTGQTGAGKSTLLNKLNPSWNLDTGEVSIALGRGRHTTRVVELFELFDGKVLDTPGFSALEFQDITDEQIREAFIEFENFPCVYKDCSHTKEPECNVKKAVARKEILESRYQDYLKFIER